MSDKDTSGPAFPRTVQAWNGHLTAHDGMTLRDYFAGQALAGLMSHESIEYLTPTDIAERTYKYADAMLEARK